MKSFSSFTAIACLSWTVFATPRVDNAMMRREAVGPGCTDCPTGSWTIDPSMPIPLFCTVYVLAISS
jgi:hypothetical protein